MNKIMQWKAEVTPGNVVSWIISAGGIVALVVWLQADVRELKQSNDRHDRRITKVEDKTDAQNNSMMEIKGDIKVIRQMLEGRRQ